MPTLDKTRLDRIKPWMQRYVDERKFAGSSVLVNQSGAEVFYHQVGLRDVASEVAFTRDTVARIYSMTKPVTSLALMMLVEEGLIHLDAPLSAALPEFADMYALVDGATSIDQVERCPVPTLHQTVTHTGGFSYPFNPGVLPKAMEEAKLLFGASEGPLAEVTKRLAQMPLAFQPGTRWEYSVGIDVIGRVVEVLSGQTLDAFFQSRIFDPLGMNETRFAVPADALDRFASLYTPLASGAMALNNAQSKSSDTLRCVDVAEKSPFRAPSTLSGGGGLVGTIDDYMRFCEALRTGGQGLVSPATLRFMMSNHLPGEIASMGPSSFAEQPMTGTGFGIGGSTVLTPARTRTPSSVGDFSWGGMASTFFWIDPVHDLSVVFFTQLSPSSSYPARPELKALIHGAMS